MYAEKALIACHLHLAPSIMVVQAEGFAPSLQNRLRHDALVEAADENGVAATSPVRTPNVGEAKDVR